MTQAEIRRLIQEALTLRQKEIGLHLVVSDEGRIFLPGGYAGGIDCVPLYFERPCNPENFKIRVAEKVIASVLYKTGTRLETDGEDFYLGADSLLYLQGMCSGRGVILWAEGNHKGSIRCEATGWWRWKKYMRYMEIHRNGEMRKLVVRDATNADFLFQ